MKLRSYEFRDPHRLITEVAERVPLREGDAYAVLVAHPSTDQRIERIELLDHFVELEDHDSASEELRELVQSWPIPDVTPPVYAVMTVLVRRGFTLFGPHEKQWWLAWRYANHFQRCFDGDMMVVTEHGWMDEMTQFGGHSPALEPSNLRDAAAIE